MPKLILHSGEKTVEYPVGASVTVGRASTNEIHLPNEPKSSRQHCRISQTSNGFILEDLESSNGTKVNGVKVMRQSLRHGDTIQIGQTRLVFDKEGEASHEAAPDTLNDPLIGTTLAGYKIKTRLGQGGMGTVYRAIQISMDRTVALKVLKPELSQNKEFARGFLKEARTMGQLTHPNLIEVHDVGETAGTLYFSMELVEGESAQAQLNREGKLSVNRSIEIAIGVAEALGHAAKHKIVHQDVKPHNVMCDKRGGIKLTDLGLATIGGQKSAMERKNDALMGTPHFMAPEQSQKGQTDTRTDIYALGVTLYNLLTGQVPFDGPNSLVVLTKHITQERPDPREHDVTIPEPLAKLVMKMMAIDPKDRPQNAAEVVKELKAIQTAYGKEQDELDKRRQRGSAVIKTRPAAPKSARVKGNSEIGTEREQPSPIADEEGELEESDDDVEAESRPGRTGRKKKQQQSLVTSLIYLAIMVAVLLAGYIAYKKLKPEEVTDGPGITNDKPVAPTNVPPPPKKTVAQTQKPIDPAVKSSLPPEALDELQRAKEKRDRFMAAGSFNLALSAFKEYFNKYPVGDAAKLGRDEQEATKRQVEEISNDMLASAQKAIADKSYFLAVAKCTRLISIDPGGPMATKAREVLEQLDSATEPRFQAVNASADKQLADAKLKEVCNELENGAKELSGTRWAEALRSRLTQALRVDGLMNAVEKARKALEGQGKSVQINVPLGGNKTVKATVKAIDGLQLNISFSEGGGEAIKNVPLRALAPNDVYQMIEGIGIKNDHIAMAHLFMLLKQDDLAKAEIERAMQKADLSEEAVKLSARLGGATTLKFYDFSKWQHQSDWDAPQGAWATENGRYVVTSPEGGDTTLKPDAIGGPFSARNAHLSFEFEPKEQNQGYFVAAEFGTDQQSVMVIFNSEGFTLSSSGASTKGAWKPSGATRVEIAFKGDSISVLVDGKESEAINVPGISTLRGTLSFRVRETPCAFDNVILRNVQ